MELFLAFISFFYLLSLSISVVPNWNLTNSAINLLSSTNYKTYLVVDREMYSMKVKLEKRITKSDTGITHENYLKIGDNGEYTKVNFENIESFYNILSKNLICPNGKNHIYNANEGQIEKSSWLPQKENWDLKCYKHDTSFFLAFYLRNGNIFSMATDFQYNTNFNWVGNSNNGASGLCEELFDFRLQNGNGRHNDAQNQWYKYDMGTLILRSNNIILAGFGAEFQAKDVYHIYGKDRSLLRIRMRIEYYSVSSGYHAYGIADNRFRRIGGGSYSADHAEGTHLHKSQPPVSGPCHGRDIFCPRGLVSCKSVL